MIVLSSTQRYWLDFLLAMTEKEIKSRYKHAVLGFLWVILNPLLQMLVIGFVFQFFIPVPVDNYFLFLFAGLLPWNFFALSLTKTTPSIIFERALIQKAKFPREGIVLSIILSNLFHFLISLSLLFIALLADKLVIDKYSLMELFTYFFRIIGIIPVILWLTVLTIGASLLTAPLNVRYRDVNFMVQAIMPLWFYATPVIYSLNLLPSFLYPLFYLNPMTGIIELFHYFLLRQEPSSWYLVSISLVITSIITWLGIYIFKKESPYFDDWI